jgi:nucleoid-associated protein
LIDLRKIIIHQLVKNQHEDIQQSEIARSLLPADQDQVIEFANKIVNIYGKRLNSAQYGIFRDIDSQANFGYQAKNYIDGLETKTEAEFIGLTEFVMQRLYDQASAVPLSTGGYIVFLEYSVGDAIFLLIAMVKKTDALNINSHLTIEALQYINLEKLTQALKINIGKFQSYVEEEDEDRSEITYLSFVSPRNNTTTAGYFVSALGCNKGAPSDNVVASILRATEDYLSHQNISPDIRRNVKSDLIDLIVNHAKDGSTIHISNIEDVVRSNVSIEDPEESDDFFDLYVTSLNNEENRVPTEFSITKSIANKFSHVSYKDENYHISLSKSLVSSDPSGEIYVSDDNKIVLNRPPVDLLEKLRGIIDEQ